MITRVKHVLHAVYPFVLVWMLLLLCSPQARAEAAANVHFVSGYVSASASGMALRQLAKGDDVLRGDRVDTADNGRIQMRFTDGGLVSLMPNSTFTVEEYFHDGGPEQDASLVFGLLKGGLRTVTGTIGQIQHDQYELKTPVATLGIRGTEYVAVLRPANTLRVHVGRGKVVITNDQGTLEVPEGRNAVVTLGSAPEISEQGPQYQATGPRGDRLVASYQHRQDPHMLDPRANMPPPGLHSFLNSPVAGGSGSGSGSTPPGPTPPGPIPPVTPPSTNYSLALALPSFAWNSLDIVNIEAEFDPSSHVMTSLSPDTFDPGTWVSFGIGGDTVLSWGEFTDGQGSVYGDPIPLNPGQDRYIAYVTGSEPVSVPSGMLTYTLQGATVARGYNSDGSLVDTGSLSSFDLGIDLSSLNYTLSMEVNMIDLGTYQTQSAAGSLFSGAQASHFGFQNVIYNPASCSTQGCDLAVQGFLAGSDADKAGVVYRIDGGFTDEVVSGAAGLDRVP